MTASSDALLLEMLKQVRGDIADESEARRADNEAARQSRSVQHGRIDEIIERLSRIDTTVALAGQVDAQVRTELDALKKAVSDIRPAVDEWRRIRALGLGIVGLVAAGGASLGAIIVWGGNTFVDWIRAWLHIH